MIPQQDVSPSWPKPDGEGKNAERAELETAGLP
jgi:hypothetical protein